MANDVAKIKFNNTTYDLRDLEKAKQVDLNALAGRVTTLEELPAQVETIGSELDEVLPTGTTTELHLVSGYTLSSSGVVTANSSYSYCEDYFAITANPSIKVYTDGVVGGTEATVGKRFYDSSKSCLGTSYSSSAVYVRFVYASATISGVLVTINGEQATIAGGWEQVASQEDLEALETEVSTLTSSVSSAVSDISTLETSVSTMQTDLDSILSCTTTELNLVSGYAISSYSAGGTIVSSTTFSYCSDYFPITSSPTIVVTINGSTVTVGKRFYDSDKTIISDSYTSSAAYVRFTYQSLVVDDTVVVTIDGTQATIDGGWKQVASQDDFDALETEVETLAESIPDMSDYVQNDTLFDYSSVNMVDPSKATFDRRYNGTTTSASYGQIVALTSYCGSGMIEVEEGKTYTISGDAFYNISSTPQGGYFDANATGAVGDTQVVAITFYTPAMGEGRCFTVPTGQDIKYVCFLMKPNDDRDGYDGNAMMNEGELAKDYQAYQLVSVIKEDLLPESSSSSTDDFAAQWLQMPSGISYGDVGSKLSTFRSHYMLKDKDLVVLNTGSSLTASANQNNSVTLRDDAAYRPPLLQANNFASYVWDKLAWSNQYYRRYDAMTEEGGETAMFTEGVTFTECTTYLSEWDLGGSFRPCYLHYVDVSSVAATLSFQVPANAYQFNFIHCTDTEGSQTNTIVIAEGDDYMEVWNGSAWVEANGYVFSERESAETYLDSVTFVAPSTGTESTLSNYKVKGNHTYQKRLKMRSTSDYRDVVKNVTITASVEDGARFMYWGVEWSLRPYMITFINAARGSHNPLISINSLMRELNHYQDNEVWSFEPDLIFTENPIINAGSSGPERYSTIYWNNVTNNFFFADNGVSMYARAKSLLGETYADALEWVIFNTTPSSYHSVTEDGDEMCEANTSGDYLTWLDANEMTHLWLLTNHPEVVSVNAARFWRESALVFYGSVATAMYASSAESTASFLVDGTHWNELGCKVMAKCILPVLDFIV